MRVLIHGINYAPESIGVGKYTGEMAGWLAARGHEVRVVTAPPYYPAWRVAPGYAGWRYRREWMAGVEVWRCPIWVPSHPTGPRRIAHVASFAAAGFPVMLAQRRWRPDLVLAVEPTLLCAVAALALARSCGARSWLHVQDFELDAAFALGLLASPRARRAMAALERRLMERFDRVSTISRAMRGRLIEKGVEEGRTALFPNWVDLETIRPLPYESPLKKVLDIPTETRVALYAGSIGRKQGLEVLVEAARLLVGRTDLLFLLCGNGAGRARLVQAADGLPNVRFLPLQPPDELNALLNIADLHLLPQLPGAADLVMPSKLGGMLASGRPIVATAVPGTEVHEVVQRCGVVVPPERPEILANAIRDLADAPARREALGRAARRYAEDHMARDAILSDLERGALQLVEDPPPLCYSPARSRRR